MRNHKMFHVERLPKKRILVSVLATIIALFVMNSCGISKTGYQIEDYYIAENGKEMLNTKPLNAFLFENNLRNIPFQQFLALKYKLDNVQAQEIWVTIDENRYKMIIYENSEFDKYFGFGNFSPINSENIANIVGNQPKFIAISMINNRNEDCLKPNSLFYQICTNYLKNLKDEYIRFK